ncbi:MAG TPA: alanine racemase [Tepidisphaeraceae bacterium]|nr:alanine racemase [Tepidisphaeraceae bacterium]
MPRTTQSDPRLLISRSALLQNVGVFRRSLPAGTKLCAMIKADAYGHGAAIVADALCHFGGATTGSPAVDALAVATIDEAAALPVTAVPILVFQPVENAFLGGQRASLELAIRSGWTLTLCGKSAADDVARIASSINKRAMVQVMIDTGLARSGVGVARAAELLAKVASWPSLRLAGVCTHFATADDTSDCFAAEQLRRFDEVTSPLAGKVLRHASNSAGALFVPGAALDMVRPGIGLYGIDPTCRPSMHRPLKPVMKWTAPLVGIREIPPYTGVGYGHTWRADRTTRIGLVPVGYADGYLRAFSNRGVMMVQGQPCPVVGRVSMDLTTIDLRSVPLAAIGDEVTILDNDPISDASAYKLANWADTIPYEIFCRIGPRVKRVAVDPTDPPVAREDHSDEISGMGL